MYLCSRFKQEIAISMNIAQEKINELHSKIKINITPEDYIGKVEDQLKKLRKNVNMPGFRQGNVPTGLVKKMYGKSAIADEVGKIAVNQLYNYIQENKIEFLGDPILAEDSPALEFDFGKDYEVIYEIGVMPNVEVNMPKDAFKHYEISIDDETLNENIEGQRRRLGKNIEADVVEDGDMIMGEYFEADANGNPVEGGFSKKTYIFHTRMEDDKAKKAFVGAKSGDVIKVNPLDAYKDDSSAEIYLGLKKEELAEKNASLFFKVDKANRMELADMNQEFFDSLFGAGKVNSEEEFKSELKNILAKDAQVEADFRLLNDIRAKILDTHNFEIPADFLKRWMLIKDEGKKSVDQIEEEFANSKDVIRWEIIRKKISDENNFKITEEEINSRAEAMVQSRLAEMGMPLDDAERIQAIVANVLQNQQEYERIAASLAEEKVLNHLKGLAKTKGEAIDYKSFFKLENNA